MKTFYVGIKGVIVKDGKLLLLKTNKSLEERQDYWEMPGGRINADESAEQALHRELREELPNIKNIVFDRVIDVARVHKDIMDNVSLFLVFYKVEAEFDGEPKLSEEHVDYKWVSKNEAKKLVYTDMRRAVEQAF